MRKRKTYISFSAYTKTNSGSRIASGTFSGGDIEDLRAWLSKEWKTPSDAIELSHSVREELTHDEMKEIYDIICKTWNL